jgi:hypothetical protein
MESGLEVPDGAVLSIAGLLLLLLLLLLRHLPPLSACCRCLGIVTRHHQASSGSGSKAK